MEIYYLSHTTGLDNLHSILQTGFLLTQNDIIKKNIQVTDTQGTVDSSVKPILDKQVNGIYMSISREIYKPDMNYMVLVFNKCILDRHDFYINPDDNFGKLMIHSTTSKNQINQILDNDDGSLPEVIFTHNIPMKYCEYILFSDSNRQADVKIECIDNNKNEYLLFYNMPTNFTGQVIEINNKKITINKITKRFFGIDGKIQIITSSKLPIGHSQIKFYSAKKYLESLCNFKYPKLMSFTKFQQNTHNTFRNIEYTDDKYSLELKCNAYTNPTIKELNYSNMILSVLLKLNCGATETEITNNFITKRPSDIIDYILDTNYTNTNYVILPPFTDDKLPEKFLDNLIKIITEKIRKTKDDRLSKLLPKKL